MKEIIKRYIDKIDVIYSTGNATEHSYRGEFKQLCEECLNINHKKGKKGLYTLVNEPKRKAYGAPDYELLKDDISIAFIEAKQGNAIGNSEWSLVYVSDIPTDKNVNPRGGAYLFPLYSYDDSVVKESHLLKGISQSDFITQYPVAEGSDIVTKRVFEADENGLGKVWINDTKYFDNVPKETWDLVISGYQPLDKWLKDRMNKTLTGDEIRHFQKVVVALSRTSKLMEEIDRKIALA